MRIPLWRDLEPRTRLVFGVSALILVALLTFLALEPFIVERHRLTAEIPRLREDLTWMKAHVPEIQRLQPSADSIPGLHSAILAPAVVEEFLRNYGLQNQVTDMKPGRNGDVTIAFDEVSYATLMTFLFDLNRRNGTRINQALVVRLQDKPGKVKASLSLGSGRQM